MLRRIAIGLVLALLVALPSMAQDSQKGVAAYDRGDYATALRIFRPLAARGSARAQNGLGRMYGTGRGVPQDYAEAVKWYRKAAKQGYAIAQFNIGGSYDYGQGVPQNFIQAYMWYSLAAAKGDKDGEKNRDSIAERMTLTQIAKAQNLARKWRPNQQVARANPERAGVTPPLPRARSSGSGFFVNANGHVLTNHHVVEGCRKIKVNAKSARVVASDKTADLALLKSDTKSRAYPKFRMGRGVRLGEDVVVAGFPLRGLLGSGLNVTKGTVSALKGPANNRRLTQITAPVQPGNSGGPVLDSSGNVVGVVVSKLDAIKTAKRIGTLPENINFAIKAGTVRDFLDSENVPYRTSPSGRPKSTADIAAEARKYTVLVECWK